MSETMEPCPQCGEKEAFWKARCPLDDCPIPRAPATPAHPHVNETPKSEHDARDALTAQAATEKGGDAFEDRNSGRSNPATSPGVTAGAAQAAGDAELDMGPIARLYHGAYIDRIEALTADVAAVLRREHDANVAAFRHQAARARAEADLAAAVEAGNALSEQAAHVAAGACIPAMNIHESAKHLGPLVAAWTDLVARIKEKRT